MLRAKFTVTLEPEDVAAVDLLSEQDGNSGRNAVIRKAVRRLAESDIESEKLSKIRRTVAQGAAA